MERLKVWNLILRVQTTHGSPSRVDSASRQTNTFKLTVTRVPKDSQNDDSVLNPTSSLYLTIINVVQGECDVWFRDCRNQLDESLDEILPAIGMSDTGGKWCHIRVATSFYVVGLHCFNIISYVTSIWEQYSHLATASLGLGNLGNAFCANLLCKSKPSQENQSPVNLFPEATAKYWLLKLGFPDPSSSKCSDTLLVTNQCNHPSSESAQPDATWIVLIVL